MLKQVSSLSDEKISSEVKYPDMIWRSRKDLRLKRSRYKDLDINVEIIHSII